MVSNTLKADSQKTIAEPKNSQKTVEELLESLSVDALEVILGILKAQEKRDRLLRKI